MRRRSASKKARCRCGRSNVSTARSRSEKSGPDWRKKNIRLVRPRPAARPRRIGQAQLELVRDA